MPDDSLYRKIGKNVGLTGLSLDRYAKYMITRYPTGLDILFATGTARTFANGHPEVDLDGKRILEKIEKDIDFIPANDKYGHYEVPVKEKGLKLGWDSMSFDSRVRELQELGEAEGYAHDSLKDLPPAVRKKIEEHLGKASYRYTGESRENEHALHTELLG